MKKLTLGISIAAIGLASAAYAGQQGGAKADANGDGVVTRSEMMAQTTERFARMDVNSDGKLDQTDRRQMREQRREQMFGKLDADSNGQISKDEFMSAERKGDRMGKRSDGERGKRWGHKRGGNKMMKMADTNNDGAISQAEFTTAAGKHFDMMDADKDGNITAEERQAARKAMHEKWKAKKQARTEG
jgi:Ca2+-binding EF-hand superfamily protein